MSLAKNFIIELSTERLAFIPFYQHIQKQLCQEVMDFFLAAYHYRLQPAGLRLINEKVIFNHFISRKSKKQVNLAEKLLKKIEENMGKGTANVFDEALFHCAESLATNYWLDFTKSDAFKNIDKKKKKGNELLPFGSDDLKKSMKKANIPSYITEAALAFFNGDDWVNSGKTKLKDSESFETWFFAVKHQLLVGHVMTMCKADSDRPFCDNLLSLLYDRPKTIFHLFSAVSESTVTPEIAATSIKLHEKRKKEKVASDLKIDPFNVNDDSYSSFFFRFYLKRVFEETFKPSLVKLITELYKGDFNDKQLARTYIAPIETALGDIVRDMDSHSTEKWRLKLLLQALFNVSYPRFKEDKEATLHAISTVLIEYICHCVEYPAFLGLEVVDGVRARAPIGQICNMLRNHAYLQNVFATDKDRDLYELWIVNPNLAEFMKWLEGLIKVGFEKKSICIKVNESIDIFYENFYPPGIVRELEFVAKHFVSKGALITPNLTKGEEAIGAFLSKNVDFCAKAVPMKFDS
jgi:hypothetical protein